MAIGEANRVARNRLAARNGGRRREEEEEEEEKKFGQQTGPQRQDAVSAAKISQTPNKNIESQTSQDLQVPDGGERHFYLLESVHREGLGYVGNSPQEI